MEKFKVCTKCGVEKPDTFEYFIKTNSGKTATLCKECKSEYDKEYRRKNKERIAEYHKQYAIKNKEKIKSYNKEYREKNIDKLKQYYEENKERISEYNKQYRSNNRENLNAEKRKWTEENKKYLQKYRIINKERDREKQKIWSQTERGKKLNNQATQKRRKRIKSLPFNFTDDNWKECLEYFDYRCAYCGKKAKLEHEHFIPIVKHGNYTSDNILCSCRTCNASKADDDFFHWYPLQDFYSKKQEEKILKYLSYQKQLKGCVINA